MVTHNSQIIISGYAVEIEDINHVDIVKITIKMEYELNSVHIPFLFIIAY